MAVALPFTVQQVLAALATLAAALILAQRLFGRKLPPGPSLSFPFLGVSRSQIFIHCCWNQQSAAAAVGVRAAGGSGRAHRGSHPRASPTCCTHAHMLSAWNINFVLFTPGSAGHRSRRFQLGRLPRQRLPLPRSALPRPLLSYRYPLTAPLLASLPL